MKYILKIRRRERGSETDYFQSFFYEPQSESDTAATALESLGKCDTLTDINGEPARKIEWERSCLQQKCGACAMVINGRPQLACAAVLAEFKSSEVLIEPLRKFPTVCDLIVDRTTLFENLKIMKLWLNDDADRREKLQELAYRSSECIQCGCCLEVCPNFYVGGRFFGMSTVPITTRLLSEMPKQKRKEIMKLYDRHTFAGCGKSLACSNTCPKKIDTEELLVNVNRLRRKEE